MKLYYIKIAPVVLIAAFFIIITTACRKTAPPKAIITVQDASSTILVNAKVTVYSSPNGSIISEELLTNETGQVLYEAENDCILNVKAVYEPQRLEGYGLIILKEGETYYETVTVN